jgi:hypothetical protein
VSTAADIFNALDELEADAKRRVFETRLPEQAIREGLYSLVVAIQKLRLKLQESGR